MIPISILFVNNGNHRACILKTVFSYQSNGGALNVTSSVQVFSITSLINVITIYSGVFNL